MQANYFMEQTYEPGQVILNEGDTNPCLYAVAEGEVEVVKGSGSSETLLGTLGVGDIFGEMGLIDGQPASATVRAATRTLVWLYDEAAFKETLAGDPQLAKQVIDTLVGRLRYYDNFHLTVAAEGQLRDVLYRDIAHILAASETV